MKEELNIAAILKDKPKGTKIYSTLIGDCIFKGLMDNRYPIQISAINYVCDWNLLISGKYEEKGECIIFPSRQMRDWIKFAWKKGDVLTTNTGSLTVVFDYFNTEYMSFAGKYSFCSYQEEKEDDQWGKDGENSYKTNCFHKVSDDEAKEFIKKIEEHYGGKLNLSSLEIDKQPEFNDGDVVVHEESHCIYLLEKWDYITNRIFYHARLDTHSSIGLEYSLANDYLEYPFIRSATDSEKQLLFDALANENKAWDKNKKMLVDLPKKCEFKDGDIMFVESPFIGMHTKSMIAILNKDTDDSCEFYLALYNKDYDGAVSLRTTPIVLNRMQAKVVHPATESEKQQLFEALAKEGKHWNPDTLQIEDLPKKCELKQMDLCLMSDGYDESLWNLCQFAFKDDNGFYHSIGGGIWRECIPYNDQTKHLLGTTDEWKGGEG